MAVSKQQLKEAAAAKANHLPSGVDLMRRISDGTVKKAPNEHIQSIRALIVENCDELLEVGARIRPLLVDGSQIGWVRGVHYTERRRMTRWSLNPDEYVISTLALATTLTRPEIVDLSSLELHNLVLVVQRMADYDISLFPYLSAFTSTFASENLWHSRGTQVTSFENRVVELPDGKSMKLLVPSDHARLWASLCVYREQAKARLDASWNALLQVRPMAGKSVDPLAAELKKTSQQLVANSMIPWEEVVRIQTRPNFDDGWAHAENLDTREGMMKELQGMLANDRHEQLMAKFEKQQIEAAEQRRQAIEAMARRRGGPGINEETIEVVSDADVRKRELELKKGRGVPQPIDRNKSESTPDVTERMKRYQ
jgi:hypothetical protein